MNRERNTKVIIGRRVKLVTLARCIVAKIAFSPDKCDYKDILILFEVLLRLQLKSLKDPMFKSKFGITLKVLTYMLKTMNLSKGIGSKNIKRLSEKFRKNLKHFMIPKRNFKTVLSKLKGQVEVRPLKPLGVKNSQLPPVRYIGIGYRDKGSAKKPAEDGNPSWQEIASSPIGELE